MLKSEIWYIYTFVMMIRMWLVIEKVSTSTVIVCGVIKAFHLHAAKAYFNPKLILITFLMVRS